MTSEHVRMQTMYVYAMLWQNRFVNIRCLFVQLVNALYINTGTNRHGYILDKQVNVQVEE